MKSLIIALVIGTASIVSAAQGQGDVDFDKRIINLADDPLALIHVIAVQKELGLSDEQKAAVKKQMLVDFMVDIKKAWANQRNMLEVPKEVEDTYQQHRKRLNDLFTPEQQTRMQEIVLQREGPRDCGGRISRRSSP